MQPDYVGFRGKLLGVLTEDLLSSKDKKYVVALHHTETRDPQACWRLRYGSNG